MHTGEDVVCVEKELTDRLDVRLNSSNVPDTESIELWDCRSGAGLMHFRRYNPKALATWLKQSFSLDVVGFAQLPFSDAGLAIACVLLRSSMKAHRGS
jgi:hypothetical protein